MKVRIIALIAALGLAATVGTSAAQAKSLGAPWHTEAWATAKLKTVHVWKGFRLDNHEFDYVSGNGFDTPYSSTGEQLYRTFSVTFNSAGLNYRHFYATLHTSRTGKGFYLTPGWAKL